MTTLYDWAEGKNKFATLQNFIKILGASSTFKQLSGSNNAMQELWLSKPPNLEQWLGYYRD